MAFLIPNLSFDCSIRLQTTHVVFLPYFFWLAWRSVRTIMSGIEGILDTSGWFETLGFSRPLIRRHVCSVTSQDTNLISGMTGESGSNPENKVVNRFKPDFAPRTYTPKHWTHHWNLTNFKFLVKM